MASYTDAAAIAARLGATFTPEQAATADVVAAQVTAWIDTRSGRSWQADGALVDELHTVYGDRVYLNVPPVSSVETVTYHAGYAGFGWVPLDPACYELVDPVAGVLLLPYGYSGVAVRVDYTSTSVVPADIAGAATVLAADLMTPTLNPESAGAESVSVGQNDITVKYAGAAGQQTASVKQAIAAVDAHRRPVLA